MTINMYSLGSYLGVIDFTTYLYTDCFLPIMYIEYDIL